MTILFYRISILANILAMTVAVHLKENGWIAFHATSVILMQLFIMEERAK